MMASKDKAWMVGEMKDGGDPVLFRHRLIDALARDPEHQWLAVVTHHLASVQANGIPEAGYNESLQSLDLALIKSLERGRGDLVFLVETCHGKRSYYAYVRGFEAVGRRVHQIIEGNPTQIFSYRSTLDPERRFANEYFALLAESRRT